MMMPEAVTMGENLYVTTSTEGNNMHMVLLQTAMMDVWKPGKERIKTPAEEPPPPSGTGNRRA